MDKLKFKRNIQITGGTTNYITLPKQICEYLNITKDDTIYLTAETGKHGRFIAIWKKTQR